MVDVLYIVMFENFSSMGQRFSFEEQNAKAEIFKIRNGDFMVKTVKDLA